MADIWDMHCHVVPGVDDGAKSMAVSLQMLQKSYEQGIYNVICTPHYRKGMFETSRDDVEASFLKLQQETASRFEKLRLYLGCEFHVSYEMEETALADPRYRINGGPYVLAEFSGGAPEHMIREQCYALINQNLRPVIAHGERVQAIRDNPRLIDDIHEMGGYLQMNADCILGLEGFGSKRFAAKMLKTDRVDFVGSDAHDMQERPSHLAECYYFVEKKFGNSFAVRLFHDNPARMAQGEIL
ncbi:MAG: CpsB/CapC family capsule biosynthesis tyrosine phosphatase [Lachnospiraceae bacterium]|jgi:protein-tyrosine phosphatase